MTKTFSDIIRNIKVSLKKFDEGQIDREDLILSVPIEDIVQLQSPQFDVEQLKSAKKLTKAIGTSQGTSSGKLVF